MELGIFDLMKEIAADGQGGIYLEDFGEEFGDVPTLQRIAVVSDSTKKNEELFRIVLGPQIDRHGVIRLGIECRWSEMSVSLSQMLEINDHIKESLRVAVFWSALAEQIEPLSTNEFKAELKKFEAEIEAANSSFITNGSGGEVGEA